MEKDYQAQQDKRPPQHQARQPGRETAMTPQPVIIRDDYRGSGKLDGKAALVTGGDSGIGRSVAVHFAREGADVAIVYLEESKDAEETKRMVEGEGRRCLLIEGDVRDAAFCRQAVERTVRELGRLDVLVNNAGEQFPKPSIEDIPFEQMEDTFRTNFFAYFAFAQAAVKHLPEGGAIINTTSITAFRGSDHLLDYSATKGAIASFTRSLSQSLAAKGIRVNAVAPGPIWTPLIAATFPAERVEEFGANTPMGRAGQPAELGPAYVYLASADSSYMTGQTLHLNGGQWLGS